MVLSFNGFWLSAYGLTLVAAHDLEALNYLPNTQVGMRQNVQLATSFDIEPNACYRSLFFLHQRSKSPNVSLHGVFKSMNWNFGAVSFFSKL
jgi:hypothetical protein